MSEQAESEDPSDDIEVEQQCLMSQQAESEDLSDDLDVEQQCLVKDCFHPGS